MWRYIIYNIKLTARNFEKYIQNYGYINVFSSNANWRFENLLFLKYETTRWALKGDFVALTLDNRAVFYDLVSLDAIYRPEEVRSSSRASGGERKGERDGETRIYSSPSPSSWQE